MRMRERAAGARPGVREDYAVTTRLTDPIEEAIKEYGLACRKAGAGAVLHLGTFGVEDEVLRTLDAVLAEVRAHRARSAQPTPRCDGCGEWSNGVCRATHTPAAPTDSCEGWTAAGGAAPPEAERTATPCLCSRATGEPNPALAHHAPDHCGALAYVSGDHSLPACSVCWVPLAAPSPSRETRDAGAVYSPSRPDCCSICGCPRIPIDRAAKRFGACSLVPGRDGTGGCPDPLHDYNREQAAVAVPDEDGGARDAGEATGEWAAREVERFTPPQGGSRSEERVLVALARHFRALAAASPATERTAEPRFCDYEGCDQAPLADGFCELGPGHDGRAAPSPSRETRDAGCSAFCSWPDAGCHHPNCRRMERLPSDGSDGNKSKEG
jgi:hypothetical protein